MVFLSLIKYIAFINPLLVSLEESEHCCAIYTIPSSPVGYADDVASCCLSKIKTDKVLSIAYKHSCTWRYNFNPKKCAVLVYGEDRDRHARNAQHRSFKLGPHNIPEKTEYDHVGVKACVFRYDDCIIAERLAKARKVFNAMTGLGIRKNGLTICICNIIFWSIVVPTLTYGCELWILSVNDVLNLEFFQRYVARRIQRLPQRCPKENCMFGLGWMRIERIIQVKKLLFIRSILKMEDTEVIKRIFLARHATFMDDPVSGALNERLSPIYDLLSLAVNFNVYFMINDYVVNGILPSKQLWSKRVWAEAWRLEDEIATSNVYLNECSALLKQVIGQPRYLPWWVLADKNPQMIRVSENLVKILCHSSQLKSDDFNLIGKSQIHKMCPNCDLGVSETIEHAIMQCPENENERREMFDKVRGIEDGSGAYALENCENTLYMVLGASVAGISDELMLGIWEITGVAINRIYNKILKNREGVG